jgi:crotonobetainyl-CoA:carnitine CoA-transferase CaiB-like acyl-CoA transferase
MEKYVHDDIRRRDGLNRSSGVEGPLAGVRVLDLTSVMMGPMATQILGDLGADVINIEAAGGDVVRFLGKPTHPHLCGTALNVLRNKRNVALNLRHHDARSALLAIAATCDLFITNLRAGSRERLRLTYDDLRAVRPDIVYCHAQGWASDSALGEAPAYDDVIQASSGLADLYVRRGGTPAIVPMAVGDEVSALTIVYAVLAALYHRLRTGEGQRIEVPMRDATAAFVLAMHGHDAIPQPPLGPPGYPRVISGQRAPLPTTDGYLQIVLYTKNDWAEMLTEAGLPDAANDARIQTPQTRNDNYVELYTILADTLATRSTAEWIDWCKQRGVGCSPLATLEQLLDDMPIDVHPQAGPYRQIPSPVRFSRTPAGVRRQAPVIGEHNDEVLREVGYSQEQIAELRCAGALVNELSEAK